MRKIYFILFAGILLLSCKKEQNTYVELYYQGRTPLHSTFNVPLKFYSEGELVLDMLLWSLDSTLESGRYTICPDEFSVGWHKGYVSKTFSRDACHWRGELIVDGYIDVQHDGDIYSFNINLTDIKGKNHTLQYSGKVINKRSTQITEYLGFFHSLYFSKYEATNYESEHYSMVLITGDLSSVYYRQLSFAFIPESMASPEGHYSVGNDHVINAYVCRDYMLELICVVSGSFSITRTNSNPPYRVDVDVMTEDGERIKGSYINGEYYIQYDF